MKDHQAGFVVLLHSAKTVDLNLIHGSELAMKEFN